jgi:hypothetical protein
LDYNYQLDNEGMLNSISNLPANVGVKIYLNDFGCQFLTDNTGTLYFNEQETPLPLPIIDVAKVIINFKNKEEQASYDQSKIPIGNFTVLSSDQIDEMRKTPLTMQLNLVAFCPKFGNECLPSSPTYYFLTVTMTIKDGKLNTDAKNEGDPFKKCCLPTVPPAPTTVPPTTVPPTTVPPTTVPPTTVPPTTVPPTTVPPTTVPPTTVPPTTVPPTTVPPT